MIVPADASNVASMVAQATKVFQGMVGGGGQRGRASSQHTAQAEAGSGDVHAESNSGAYSSHARSAEQLTNHTSEPEQEQQQQQQPARTLSGGMNDVTLNKVIEQQKQGLAPSAPSLSHPGPAFSLRQ